MGRQAHGGRGGRVSRAYQEGWRFRHLFPARGTYHDTREPPTRPLEWPSFHVQGLIDAHGHVLEYGHYLQLPLLGSTSTDEIVRRVENFVQQNGSSLPDGAWIEGMGWDQNLWPSKAFPSADVLEASPVLRGKKISLARIDVHAEWVSQAIIDELEAQPGGLPGQVDGGLIVRGEDGRPTGVFVSRVERLSRGRAFAGVGRALQPKVSGGVVSWAMLQRPSSCRGLHRCDSQGSSPSI